jgi:phosphoglycerol transferase MdoB-like AlkP superfamily enzyme
VIACFFPCREIRGTFLLFFLLFLFKILWFNVSWCAISTFRPFSYAELYVFGLLFALVLLAPFVLFRKASLLWIVDVALGLLLVSNLVYFRTYYTAIPLSSYGLVGNMRDFTGSISGSLYWGDLLFPLSTLAAVFLHGTSHRMGLCTAILRKWNSFRPSSLPAVTLRSGFPPAQLRRPADARQTMPGRLADCGRYLLSVMTVALLAGILLHAKGGFKKSYESLQDSYTHTCGTPLYTIVGSVYYDYIRDREIYTPDIGRHIAGWLDRQTASGQPACQPESRMNCIIILAESLESWVLERTVEGQEITPCLNRLLRDSTALYAPRVLSQVKGGRSIDAQLIFNTGLLPVDIGVYSLKYPHASYPSLAKAMEEKYGNVFACTLTADKPAVWNQSVIAPAFGYDSLVSKSGFTQDEPVGPHYRHQLGDASLLRQCAAKINAGEVWKGGASLLQIVTYSGHFPFALPDHLKEVHFSDDIPSVMCDYMTAARYTDRALGRFVEAIRSAPGFDNTLIAIAGDHEGLVNMRNELCCSRAGRGVVSEAPFIPFILLNVPPAVRQGGVFDSSATCMRYEKVMGQIDIYPTLLELSGLTDYAWQGLGRSILDPRKKGLAVDAHNKVYGDTANISGEEIRHIGEAWTVSDKIIRYDYFGRR